VCSKQCFCSLCGVKVVFPAGAAGVCSGLVDICDFLDKFCIGKLDFFWIFEVEGVLEFSCGVVLWDEEYIHVPKT